MNPSYLGRLSAVRALVALASIVGGASVSLVEFGPASTGTAILRVDMNVSAGSAIQVFVNQDEQAPLSQPLFVNQRRNYEFDGIAGDLSLLRIDPSDAASAVVRVYSVAIVKDGLVLADFAPDQLAHWAQYNLEPIDEPGAFSFRATTPDPSIASMLRVSAGANSHPWRTAARQLLIGTPYVLVVVLVIALALLAPLEASSSVVSLVALVAVATATPIILAAVSSWPMGGGTVDVAIARATYLGLSVRAAQAACLVALTAAGIVGVLAALAVRNWPFRQPDGTPEPAPSRLHSTRWLIATWVAIALLVAPDLDAALARMEAPFQPTWDANNLLYWSYLTHTGALAFRDFWYVYGGFYLFDLPWPAGPLVAWMFDIALYGLLATTLWYVTPRRRSAALVSVLTLVLFDRLELMGEGELRYLLGPLVVLAFAATRTCGRSLLLLGACVGLAAVFEVVQLIYAAPAVLMVAALDGWRDWADGRSLRPTLHRVAVIAFVSIGIIGVLTGVLAATGQLRGALDLYGGLGDAVKYVAFPTPLNPPPNGILALSAVACWWPAAILALAVIDLARGGDSWARGRIGIALALVVAMTLQKHLVRAMEGHLISQIVLSGLLYVLLRPARERWAGLTATGIVLGTAGVILSVSGDGSDAWTLVRETPQRAVGAIRLLSDTPRVQLANQRRFAPERFVNFTDERALLAALSDGGRPPSVFMLTDNPILYLLTRQEPVWQSNLYSVSPVYEQHLMLDWLDRAQPQYVVFNPAALSFDSVPTMVRVPLVVSGVAARYVPDRVVGQFHVLRRRAANEEIPLDYWRRTLGTTIDLGAIPALVDLTRRRPCAGRDACEPYIQIELETIPASAAVEMVPFSLGGLDYVARFATHPGQRHYAVPLGHSWMWLVAQAAKTDAAVGLGAAPSHVRWDVLAFEPAPNVLY